MQIASTVSDSHNLRDARPQQVLFGIGTASEVIFSGYVFTFVARKPSLFQTAGVYRVPCLHFSPLGASGRDTDLEFCIFLALM